MSSDDEPQLGQLSDEELQRRFAAGELGAVASQPARTVFVKQRIDMDPEEMNAATKSIAIIDSLKWPETFLVASELPKDIDAADDLAREDAFYDATLEAVKDAAAMLKKHKIPIQRPGDYYTEMLKTDVHMRKVREKMILETQKVDASDRARKQRQNKKFGKQIQQQILLKRAKDKSSAISDASKGRKGLKQAIANRDDGFDVEVDTGGDGEPASKRSKMTRGKRDSKFGFGGAKNNKRGKRNDSNSYNQSTGKGDRFNVKRNNSTLTRGKSAAGKSGGGAGKRPGKASRAKQKRT